MPALSESPQRDRTALLGPFMFGLLLVSLGAAYWLVHSRNVPIRRAAAIIREIRTKALPAYWGSEQTTLYYVLRDGEGKALSWLAVSRRGGDDDDGYSGTTLGRAPGKLYLEDWRLLPDASAGQYISSFGTVKSPKTFLLARDISIALSNGQVTVQKAGLEFTAAAPENYVPEGLSSLVIRLVAERGQKAAFTMIINEQAIINHRIVFAPITMKPQGARRVLFESRSQGQAIIKIYHLDEDGRIVRIEFPDSGINFIRVSAEELIKAFPEARKLLRLGEEPTEQKIPVQRSLSV